MGEWGWSRNEYISPVWAFFILLVWSICGSISNFLAQIAGSISVGFLLHPKVLYVKYNWRFVEWKIPHVFQEEGGGTAVVVDWSSTYPHTGLWGFCPPVDTSNRRCILRVWEDSLGIFPFRIRVSRAARTHLITIEFVSLQGPLFAFAHRVKITLDKKNLKNSLRKEILKKQERCFFFFLKFLRLDCQTVVKLVHSCNQYSRAWHWRPERWRYLVNVGSEYLQVIFSQMNELISKHYIYFRKTPEQPLWINQWSIQFSILKVLWCSSKM